MYIHIVPEVMVQISLDDELCYYSGKHDKLYMYFDNNNKIIFF